MGNTSLGDYPDGIEPEIATIIIVEVTYNYYNGFNFRK